MSITEPNVELPRIDNLK